MAILEDETMLSALEQGVSAEELAQRLGSPDSPTTGASGSELTGALLQALHSEGALVREAGTTASPKTSPSCARCTGGWSC